MMIRVPQVMSKKIYIFVGFVSPGPLAVPASMAQGHGGTGAAAEGTGGNRWQYPGCPQAHICWRSPGSKHIPY